MADFLSGNIGCYALYGGTMPAQLLEFPLPQHAITAPSAGSG
jgi:hypothetical protein